jgi:pilus assembly protein TadC
MLHKLEPLFLTKRLRERLVELLKVAGSKLHIRGFFLRVFFIAVVVNIISLVLLFYKLPIFREYHFLNLVIVLASAWIVMFFIIFILVMVVAYFLLQVRIHKRKTVVEDVFADFLQITATNIRAGMSIDRALWASIRPRFGILAKEMETIAKKTMSGKELSEALDDFVRKYKSPILRRSINLIKKGAESGGQIADLLSNIAWNIQETKLMRKEMTANVTSYIIFITATSIFIAPFLFALSSQLITIMTTVTSNIDLSAAQGAMSGMPISFSAGSISSADFRIFAYSCLGITAFFSAMIVSTIAKGSAKTGMKLIPIFLLISFTLFTGFSYLLNMIFSSFF